MGWDFRFYKSVSNPLITMGCDFVSHTYFYLKFAPKKSKMNPQDKNGILMPDNKNWNHSLDLPWMDWRAEIKKVEGDWEKTSQIMKTVIAAQEKRRKESDEYMAKEAARIAEENRKSLIKVGLEFNGAATADTITNKHRDWMVRLAPEVPRTKN